MMTSQNAITPFPLQNFQAVRQALLNKQAIALLDVREEDAYAHAHPLFAANLPLSRISFDARRRIPRLDTLIVLYDAGKGLAQAAAQILQQLGYSQVHLLDGGLQGWQQAGGELFKDVNAPSKAFGELVDAQRHTPMLSAQEVKALLDARANVVVLDAGTRIIVNCAGRTRSIIGTQSLVNVGIANPVAALRNGTIGWTLAGQTLEHGAGRRANQVSEAQQPPAVAQARTVADRAGVKRSQQADVARFRLETTRMRPCKPTWTENMAWSRNWRATAHTGSRCSEQSHPGDHHA